MLELLELATLILNVLSSIQILIYNEEDIVILFWRNFLPTAHPLSEYKFYF
jgi:hypothetical protein